MKTLWVVPLIILLSACTTEESNRLHDKLICVVDTQEAYIIKANIGNNVILRRNKYADNLCKEQQK